MNQHLTNMKLCDTGHFLLDYDVANSLISGAVFGLDIKLFYEERPGVFIDAPHPFLREKGRQIAGTVDIGNGERRRLVATFSGQMSPARFNYVLSEIPEEVDEVHKMD